MNVKELVFNNELKYESKIIIVFEDNELKFKEISDEFFTMDRSEAHLLMLYLQEHLGYVSISKDRLDDPK